MDNQAWLEFSRKRLQELIAGEDEDFLEMKIGDGFLTDIHNVIHVSEEGFALLDSYINAVAATRS
jgi:hypothetical protein